MAVTAKFLADFASFHAAVEKAEVELKSMETGANKVGGSLNRMVDSFSGRKLVQDATLAAEAVERIGGTSKLTQAELARVQGQATAAADKLRAMGQDVPPGIQKIADTVKGTGGALDSMKGVLGSVAGAFGVAFSVGAVINFGKKVFDTASEIHDLSSKLGISTDAVQGFKFAAEQSGSSLDAVGTAINKMNANLAGGDKATVQALKDAGLQFGVIRNLKPEDAFLAITDAIQQIPDPMTQADVAMALFGKSASDLLPAVKEGFRGLSGAASKMSEDTINSLEAAQDAWGRLTDKVVIFSGTIISHAMNTTTSVTSSWRSFIAFADNAVKFGVGAAAAMADSQETAAKAAAKNRDVNLSLAPAVKKSADELNAAATAAKKHADALDALFRKFSGADATAAMKDLDIVFRRMADSGKITEAQVGAIAKEAAKLSEQGVLLTPRLFAIVMAMGELNPKVTEGIAGMGTLGEKFEIAVPPASELAKALTDVKSGIANIIGEIPKMDLGFQFGTFTKKAKEGKDAIGELAQAFAQLETIAGGSLGSIVKGLGTFVASIDAATKGMKSFSVGKKEFDDPDGSNLQGIIGMASGILGIASAAIAAGKAIAGLFNRNKGRDIVEDFAKSVGGFNVLQKQLEALGDEGARLWVKLTQGVGKNNPEQARAAVEEVTEALAKHKKAQEEVVVAAEKTGVAESEAYKKAKDALSTLDDQIKTLSDSIAGEAPEEFMGIVEQQTRERIKGLTAEREAAQQALEALGGTMTDSINEVADAIRALPDKIVLEFEAHTRGAGGESPEGFAGGGRVLPFAVGGRVPSSTDTVHAMLTPGEIVLNAAQQKNVAGALGGAITINVSGAGDPDAVADAIMRKLRREKRLNVA